MIVVQQMGGLGNQMFQYAAARSLSVRLKEDLALDVSAYAVSKMHQGFELLRIFNIQPEIAEYPDIEDILGLQAYPVLRKIMKYPVFAALRNKSWVIEPDFNYWEGIQGIAGPCYLSGYWQSEKYFTDIEEVIRKEFAFKKPMQGANALLAGKMSSENSISLHVRRGDYLVSPKFNAVHGVCSLEYYRAALQYLVARIMNPVVYVFSDDLPWVRENMRLECPHVYVDQNPGESSYIDMQLMSHCRHHIIANSSFSWWGAWLNANPDKIVVAPEKWFANGRRVPDLIPTGWIKI